jgi:hypothetical protein
MPTKYEYTVFPNHGFKVNHTTFQLVPLSDEYAHDEPVYLDEIAPWDLYDITDTMTPEELAQFNKLKDLSLQQGGLREKEGKQNA